jgi:ubiquinone biosynthesis protein
MVNLLNAAVRDVAQLVPERYAAFRILVSEGLRFFLERLSAGRLARILSDQAEMSAATGLPERATAFLRHCPTLQKLGQVVARDRRLAPELRKSLQQLESSAPVIPITQILPIIRREVGEDANISVARRALAEGSVGVVVPFTWRETGSSVPRRGVFKLLKPGVEGRLREELDIWSALGPFLEERSTYYGLPELSYRETFDGVRRQLLSEIRLDKEQGHLIEAAKLYTEFPEILIPRVLPFSTARVTAMERVYGRKVTRARTSVEERQRLAETITEALLARPFWSPSSGVTFHADPHAGNLFLTRDGRLAILDWSLVVRLGKRERVRIVQVILTALALDEAGLCEAVADLTKARPEESILRAVVRDALHKVRAGTIPALDWMLALLDRLATSCRVEFSEGLALFRKALLALLGVLADVSENPVADRVLIRTGVMQLTREFLARFLAPPGSRKFGTHVSNEDLFRLLASWPLTATRFWLGMWQDRAEEARAVLLRQAQ